MQPTAHSPLSGLVYSSSRIYQYDEDDFRFKSFIFTKLSKNSLIHYMETKRSYLFFVYLKFKKSLLEIRTEIEKWSALY